MSSNYCIIPECYIDSCLTEVLLNAGKEPVNHQKGNGTVAKKMKESFNNEFCVGIIDEDKNPIDYLKEFEEKKSDDFLKLWKHKRKHHYIIQIRPVVESWFLKICNEKGINLADYDLPHGGKELLRKTKSVSSRKDERFISLFRRLVNEDCEPVLKLKRWIEFLKENKYNSNLDLI